MRWQCGAKWGLVICCAATLRYSTGTVLASKASKGCFLVLNKSFLWNHKMLHQSGLVSIYECQRNGPYIQHRQYVPLPKRQFAYTKPFSISTKSNRRKQGTVMEEVNQNSLKLMIRHFCYTVLSDNHFLLYPASFWVCKSQIVACPLSNTNPENMPWSMQSEEFVRILALNIFNVNRSDWIKAIYQFSS